MCAQSALEPRGSSVFPFPASSRRGDQPAGLAALSGTKDTTAGFTTSAASSFGLIDNFRREPAGKDCWTSDASSQVRTVGLQTRARR